MSKNVYNEVYPFTTENVSGYINEFELENKSVLTVGSCLDQAFSALIKGAHVTVYDICPNTLEFYKLKKNAILTTSRKKLYYKVLESKIPLSRDIASYEEVYKMVDYLKDDSKYEKLREKLKDDSIDFITGDIFKMDEKTGKTFDVMLFSNVLQNLSLFCPKDLNELKFLRANLDKWIQHLNPNGILQLIYYYNFSADLKQNIYYNYKSKGNVNYIFDLNSVYNMLRSYHLDCYIFDGCKKNTTDAVLCYKKR